MINTTTIGIMIRERFFEYSMIYILKGLLPVTSIGNAANPG